MRKEVVVACLPYHISPLSEVKVYTEGSLVVASRWHIKKEKEKRIWKRGRCKLFSRGSRRRMLRRLATIDKNRLPLFVTLTYSDVAFRDPLKAKRDLDCLRKRIARRGSSAIWRLEIKRRKSGVNEGRFICHFHLLVWGEDKEAFSNWLYDAWREILGVSSFIRIDVDVPRSWGGVAHYVSKYMSKVCEEEVPGKWGRSWGVINSQGIPWSMVETVFVGDKDVLNFFRYMRRYAKLRLRSRIYELAIFVDCPFRWLNLFERGIL